MGVSWATRAAALTAVLGAMLAGCVSPAANLPPPDPLQPPAPPPPAIGTLTAAFVDVGQGDGTVWKLPDGSFIVYDCGPPAANASVNPIVQYLEAHGKPRGSRLWAVIASHGHLDHMGGCEEVVAEYQIDHIYEVGYGGTDAPSSYARWLDNIRASNATVHTAFDMPSLDGEVLFHQRDALVLPAAAFDAGLRVQILWPPASPIHSWTDIGFYSLVLRWSFGSIDLCTPGDIEAGQEATLADAPDDLNCEVYLVGHHGSGDSSSVGWLTKMQPKAAIVSVGNNTFGHPTAAALCRLQMANALVYVTQRWGTIEVLVDNRTFFMPASVEREGTDYCVPGAVYTPSAPPPPPPPPPGADLNVSAWIDDTNPCQFTTVVVQVHVGRGANATSGAAVSSVWHYKTSAPLENGTTDAGGNVTLSRYISGASAGYTVIVDVTATDGNDSAFAAASFTPKAC